MIKDESFIITDANDNTIKKGECSKCNRHWVFELMQEHEGSSVIFTANKA